MWECEETTHPTARKEHTCNACEWLFNYLDDDDIRALPAKERHEVEQARANNQKIIRGQQYLKVRGKYDGEFQTFRAIPAIDKICQKYDLYDE